MSYTINSGTTTAAMEVDPTFSASRHSVRPLEYVSGGTVLGHYSVAQRSGSIVGSTVSALDHHAALRWTDATHFLVLERLRVGLTWVSATTTSTEFAYRAIIVRNFSVDYTTARTAINMTTIAGSNAMRKTMGTSLLGTVGPQICTTLTMSGQTLTADTAPFAIASLPPPSPTLGASAVTIQVGAAVPMVTLYEYTSPAQHPVILSYQEGVVVQPVLAGPGSGTYGLYCEWTWAEVSAY